MKFRISLILGILVLMGGAFIGLRPMLAPALFERAVAQRMSVDRVADLGPGLHVVLIGTGAPLPDPSRVGPMTGVVADGRLFIFDAGGGAVRRMGEIGFPGGQVERAFLTHLHSDHIDGLGELMLQHWAGGGADAPLPIAGPDGVEDVVAGLMQAYARDRDFRIAHHGEAVVPPSGFGAVAEVITPGVVYDDGSVRVIAFLAEHAPVSPALGYVVTHAGKTVVLTGDSTANVSLPSEARGADLLLAEALNVEMVGTLEAAARATGNDRLAKIFFDIPDYHMTPKGAAELGQRIDAKRTVLTHLVPAAPNRMAERLFLGDADAEIGRDGMVITLRD